MMLAGAACLVLALVFGFTMHVPAITVILIVLMVLCGIAGFVLAVVGATRAGAEVDQIVRDEKERQSRYPNG
jgi:fructose-specific phosphotransferase system IIC component